MVQQSLTQNLSSYSILIIPPMSSKPRLGHLRSQRQYLMAQPTQKRSQERWGYCTLSSAELVSTLPQLQSTQRLQLLQSLLSLPYSLPTVRQISSQAPKNGQLLTESKTNPTVFLGIIFSRMAREHTSPAPLIRLLFCTAHVKLGSAWHGDHHRGLSVSTSQK